MDKKIFIFIGVIIFYMTNIFPFNAQNDFEIILPQPALKSNLSVEEAIAKRRSVRQFKDEPLKLEQVSQILWAAQGVTGKSGFRTVPSAGALYPLEIYLTAGKVANLPAGIYHYNPANHSIKKIIDGDKRANICTLAFSQTSIKTAPVSIIICAKYERVTKKYDTRGIRFVDMEAGHCGQNIYLQAESLGLATVAIGALNDEDIKNFLTIPELPLYIFPVGKK